MSQTKLSVPFPGADVDRQLNVPTINEEELFDREFYLSRYRDVRRSRINPFMHFQTHGALEGRSPHPLFDSNYYCTFTLNDGLGAINPLSHFLHEGYRMDYSPHPLFDMDYYRRQVPGLDQNPLLHFLREGYKKGFNPHPLFDIAYYCGQLGESLIDENPLLHFLENGVRLRLNPHPLFDTSFYLDRYRDVKNSGINPLVHYLVHGQKEGRLLEAFDQSYYRDLLPEGMKVGGNEVLHYLTEGYKLGLSPNPLFDFDYYRKQAGELLGGQNPFVHFLSDGWRLGLNPHPLFDVNYYLSKSVHARKSKLNPLVHFLRYGKAQRIRPHPFFDTHFYLSKYPDVEKSSYNPLLHFVRWGAQEGRWPNASFDSLYYSKTIAPISSTNPLIHYLNYGQGRKLSTCPLQHSRGRFSESIVRAVRILAFSCLSLLHALRRHKIDPKTNYDHQFSVLKFWLVALARVLRGRPSEVRYTVPTYLMQPKRLELPERHAHRVLKAPVQFAYLYLANVFKTEGYFADSEYILRKLSMQPAVRDLALCSLGDLLFLQACWANEFKSYAVEGIALNHFSGSRSFFDCRTWYDRTFEEALSVIKEALQANEKNTDAQWLLCYGQVAAGNYLNALDSLNKYPGRSSEIAERNLLRARANYGLKPEEGVAIRRQFLSGLGENNTTAHLKLVNIAAVPLSAVQEHIKVIDSTELPIQSTIVRNREAVSFKNILQFGESYLSKFNNVQIIPEYGMVVVENQFLIRESAHVKLCHMPIFNSSLKEITDEGAFISAPYPALYEEENCIYIGVNNNFYHWLIEELPKLSILERVKLFSNAPIVVDCEIFKWQSELLSMLGVELSRLRKVNFKRPILFQNLIVPSRLSRDMVAHPEAVSFVRKKLLNQTGDLKPVKGKRLYVDRRGGVMAHRGMLNKRNIIDKFKRANFQLVDTNKLSIKEQIELFCDAEVIAGPGGAALTNILFAPKGARVLSLGSSAILCETFTSIAAAIGQESWSVRGRSYPRAYPNWIWTNFDFEIDEIDIDFCFDRIL